MDCPHIPQSTVFMTFIIEAAVVTFRGCLWRYIIIGKLVCIAYIDWQFVRQYPFLIGFGIFPPLLTNSFICITFPVDTCLDFRPVVHY
jgi:hypothetical protein